MGVFLTEAGARKSHLEIKRPWPGKAPLTANQVICARPIRGEDVMPIVDKALGKARVGIGKDNG
jgi:hypothetical protein